MSLFSKNPGSSLHHLTDGYSWATIGSGTVVDVGGSRGHVSFAIARKYPKLRLVVQDLPRVIGSAKEEPGLNVKFMAHDFFDEQPIKHADVYLYRNILHNWPDKYALKILRALIPALQQGSRLVVMNTVLPPPNVLSNLLDRKIRYFDTV